MSSFLKNSQLRHYLNRLCKNILHGRTNMLTYVRLQIREYTKKSAEEKLGIAKPKKPLNPFFKFMRQMRPVLNAKIPGISAKEAVIWSSKHWQRLEYETKAQMKHQYENELKNYQKEKAIYEASLTEEQKGAIKRVKREMIAIREKQKLKSEINEMGKPKKPISSYILYAQSRNDVLQSHQIKEYQEKIRADWLKLPESERAMFDKKAQDLMKKYKKDVEAWELEMISMGRLHLVRQKPQNQRKAKSVLKSISNKI